MKEMKYYIISIVVRDNDQDCPEILRNDKMTSTMTVTIQIKYIDQEPPIVTTTYVGGYTDGNAGYIHVIATDNIGFSIDPSGNYPLDPSIINTPQIFTFTAIDLYNNVGHASISITLYDDDIINPTINAIYYGDYTDGNAGYIEVIAFDSSGLCIDPSGIYYLNLNIVGIPQIFSFIAVDNDNDRLNDQLSTIITISITLVDDDTTVDITNMSVVKSLLKITVSFVDIDYSGIDMCDWIRVDGELVDFTYVSEVIEFANNWVFELSLHTIEFQLTDIDNDRYDDATIDIFSIIFEITEDLIKEFLYEKLYDLRCMVVSDIPSDCWKQAPSGKGTLKLTNLKY